MNHRFPRFLLLSLTLIAAFAPAGRADLQNDIQAILSDNLLRNSTLSIAVVSLADGRPIYAKSERQPLIPASNLKMVTTSAALHLLGPDFRFRTLLVQRGEDLVLIGDGDPSFGDAELLKKSGLATTHAFEQWAASLKGRTFRHALVDDSIFDQVLMHPHWDEKQFQNRFSAEVTGMTFNAGGVDLAVKSALGGNAIYRMTPATKYAPVRNTCVTGGRGGVIITRNPGSNLIQLRGSCTDTEVTVGITIHDPALLAATVMQETLLANGVRFSGGVGRDRSVRGNLPDTSARNLTILGTHETPLETILNRANKDSINLYAECLAKRLGAAATGKPGCWDSGADALAGFLKRIGVGESEFNIEDGSGLSRENRISAAAIVHVLRYNFSSRYREQFMNSLAVGGKDGTLDSRFRNMRGRVLGKSGYIANVSSLSGYLKGRDEKWYAFSILMNGVPGGANARAKQLQESIVKAIDSSLQRGEK